MGKPVMSVSAQKHYDEQLAKRKEKKHADRQNRKFLSRDKSIKDQTDYNLPGVVKETKVGAFLTEKAPKLVSQLGEFLPDQGGLGIVKNIITSDNTIEPKDKETALKLLDQDIAEMENISNRWMNDMRSDSWLSKNTSPC